MIDTPAQPTPRQEPPLAPPAPASPRPRNPNQTAWIIGGIAIVLLCGCSILLCLLAFTGSITSVFRERAPVEAVLDAYMQSMADKDAENAYDLFSPRARRQFSLSDVQQALEGDNYRIFEGYQSISVTNINISAAANADPDEPQGRVARVSGVVTYAGGIQGTFEGVLEKVGGEWMLHVINVTVPPDKFK